MTKLMNQRMETIRRFSKPMRYERWTTSQAAQAGRPLSRMVWRAATARARPIVARLP
jgi:hypothetical protein